jgi:hypothetical protein
MPRRLEAFGDGGSLEAGNMMATTVRVSSATQSVGFADGRAALALAEAANESVATGKVVTVTGG